MEEKKITELSDEELDKVAGGRGSGSRRSRTTCPNCNGYSFHSPPMDDFMIVLCHNCHATITYLNGEIQSIEVPQWTHPTHSTDPAGDTKDELFPKPEYETPL